MAFYLSEVDASMPGRMAMAGALLFVLWALGDAGALPWLLEVMP